MGAWELNRPQIAQNVNMKCEKQLNIISFNLKNVKTSANAILELFQSNDIILIQEHWQYECQNSILGEISDNICFAGKGVDINNPIQPVQMPRGYAGDGYLMETGT